MSQGHVYNEVQAALVNSEASAEYVVERALHAVIRFAQEELEMTAGQFGALSAKLWVLANESDAEGRDAK